MHFLSQEFVNLQEGVGWATSLMEVQVEKTLPPDSLRLLADFISLWLQDGELQLFAGCWLEAALGSKMPPLVPCHTAPL